MCVLIFSTSFFPETFRILRRIQREDIIYVHMSSCTVPVIYVRMSSCTVPVIYVDMSSCAVPVIYVHMSCAVPVIYIHTYVVMYITSYSRNNLIKLEFSRRIWKKNFQISNFVKIRPIGAELFHADRHTHRHNKDNRRFLQFCQRAQNVLYFPVALPPATSFTRFQDHTQRRNTFGNTSLDEPSACRRDL
jgi:hypothetical protein